MSSTQDFEVFFPGKVLSQRTHFAVLMLKSSFNSLGATMKSQKWSKSEALGSNSMFTDELADYYNVCISKSFKVLANNFDIHFTWTHCVLVITFQCTYVDRLKCNTYIFSIGIPTLIWHSKSRVRVLHINYLFYILFEILTTDIIFMTKKLLLAF